MENFGLYRVSGRLPWEECDDCHAIGSGHWYQDQEADDGGETDWFMCDKCANATRAKRMARQEEATV